MPERGKELFERLKSAKAILALIGESEDSHLDCKQWPSDDKEAQKMLAKARHAGSPTPRAASSWLV